jgi:pyrimidine operon attenuation protein/uracil phosphoribosyltransferase
LGILHGKPTFEEKILMSVARTQILTHEQVKQIVKRMAYQIYERNFNAKELCIAGISGRGETIASLLAEELTSISGIKIMTITIMVNKDNPSESSTQLSVELKKSGMHAVIVDDVLNTGRTLIYALLPFLKLGVATIQTAILVDRNHKTFPVAADFIGISLSTTLQEHIAVTIEKKKVNVFLQ